MRVSSLEYLGQVASRLRKDAISSVMDEERLNTIVREVRGRRILTHFEALCDQLFFKLATPVFLIAVYFLLIDLVSEMYMN